ncbi:Tyrosine recombinase XerC [compost metagenome]
MLRKQILNQCQECGESIGLSGICYRCRNKNQREAYQAMSRKEVEKMVESIISNIETIGKWDQVYQDFNGLLGYHDINTARIAQAALDKGNKERKLVLTPKLIRALDSYYPVRHTLIQKRNRIDENALLISEKQGKRLTRRAVQLIIEEIAKEADVRANNKKVTPHKLRHTCATVLYNDGEGADLLALAELLGHADPKTTTIYTKVNIEKMRKIVTSNPLEST